MNGCKEEGRRLPPDAGKRKTLAWSEASGVALIEQDGLYFKDLERCGSLLPYEDWRLSDEARAEDLAKRLTLEEIAGLMLYSPHQAVPPQPAGPFGGTYGGKPYAASGEPPYALSDQQKEFMEREHIRHILMITVQDAGTAARWSNALQARAESLPHGIPVNISSDPRNGARGNSGMEFKTAAQRREPVARGRRLRGLLRPRGRPAVRRGRLPRIPRARITTALGPQIDLCTEPRWMRFVDTLGENVEMTKQLVKAYCDGMQTTQGSETGWGPRQRQHDGQALAGRRHRRGRPATRTTRCGKYAVYPTGNAAEHMKPFTEAAFRLDGPTGAARRVMPYYTVSWGLDTKNGKNVGNSYSEYLIKDLLREKYGFRGVVCTDWGITHGPAPDIDAFGSRCFNMEDKTEAERCLTAILNGVDQFGGNSEIAPIVEAYRLGCARFGEDAMRARMERSAARLLKNIFQCGLFEDPYLDPEQSVQTVGCKAFCDHGFEAQHKSVVLLKNRKSCLPLKKGLKIYTPVRQIRASKGFMRNDIPAHTEDPVTAELLAPYGTRVETPEVRTSRSCSSKARPATPYSKGGRRKRRQRLPADHAAVPPVYGGYRARRQHRGRATSARTSRTAATAARRTPPTTSRTSTTSSRAAGRWAISP